MKRIVNYRFFPSAGTTYEAETLAYIDRVQADGGEVTDVDYVDSVYVKLKELNLLSSLKFFTDIRAGIRKDSANYVSKLYSIDNNSNDVKQTTGSLQPLLSANGIELGGKYLEAFTNTNFNLLTTEKLTLGANFIPYDITGNGGIFANIDTFSGYNGFDFWKEDYKFGSHIIKAWPDDALKTVTTSTLTANVFTDIAITYDGLKKVEGMKAHKDNTVLTLSAVKNVLSSDSVGLSNFIIGGRWNSDTKTVQTPINAAVRKAFIFINELTAEQITALNAL